MKTPKFKGKNKQELDFSFLSDAQLRRSAFAVEHIYNIHPCSLK